jgi:hypothetical protein
MDNQDRQVIQQLDAVHTALSEMQAPPSRLPLQDLRAQIAATLQRCFEAVGPENFPVELRHDWNGEYQSGKPVTR